MSREQDTEHFCETPFVRGYWRCPECGKEWFVDHDPTRSNFEATPVPPESPRGHATKSCPQYNEQRGDIVLVRRLARGEKVGQPKGELWACGCMREKFGG